MNILQTMIPRKPLNINNLRAGNRGEGGRLMNFACIAPGFTLTGTGIPAAIGIPRPVSSPCEGARLFTGTQPPLILLAIKVTREVSIEDFVTTPGEPDKAG